MTEATMQARLKQVIEEGFRVRLASSGLTGAAYLEADILDPKDFPYVKPEWEPKFPHVPSAPSTMAQLGDSLQSILKNLERLDLDSVVSRVEQALDVATEKVDQADVAAISDQATSLLVEVRQTNRNIAAILRGLDVDPIIQNTSETVAAIRRVVRNAEPPVSRTVASVNNIVTEAERPIMELLATLKDTSKNIEQLAQKLETVSEGLPNDLAQVRGTLRRLDGLVAGKEYDVKVIIDNLRLVSENLKELTNNAKKYPSQVLFGEPPKRLESGQ
jgi:phospholipid/cholesterol/gamma-HCH transport system substrate-binding protein/paraquat-inducible protein B